MNARLLLLCLLVGGCGRPHAVPGAPESPASEPCGVLVDPLLELIRKDDRTPAHPTSTLVIGRGGAWRRQRFQGDRVLERDDGCLPEADRTSLEAALRDAPWTITTGTFCEATSPESFELRIGGRVVYTRRLCDGQLLDPASQRAWTEIERIRIALSPKPT